MKLYILYESAAGYALFEREEMEEITIALPKIQAAITSMENFSKLVKLKAFAPFPNSEKALENIKAITDSHVTDDLINFLSTNFPKAVSSKKGTTAKVKLGVSDNKIGTEINEKLKIPIISNEVVDEIIRGIRLHFVKYLKKFDNTNLTKAQLALAHSYSRSQIQYDPDKQDKAIIQAIAVIDQLDKDINTFSMRIKEWFAWHFPELRQLVTDNTIFAKVVNIIGSRDKLDESMREQLLEATNDEEIVNSIYEAAKSSMGQDVADSDKEMLKLLSDRLIELINYREGMQVYLKERLTVICPSMTKLIGENIGARLISQAGGLVNLAKLPASTIQILGAEKALFRALKTKGNTPKYGLIYHSSFIGRAASQNKGRISRTLANNLAKAARIDAFSIKPTEKFGETFRDQVEERMKFVNEGPKPRKNAEVMAEVIEELKKDGLYCTNADEAEPMETQEPNPEEESEELIASEEEEEKPKPKLKAKAAPKEEKPTKSAVKVQPKKETKPVKKPIKGGKK